MSRPSLYTDELAQKICDRLVEGESLRQICSTEGMPDRGTVIRWMGLHEGFATRCARAREEQADLMDDRILEAANKTESGDLPPDAARVVISALQWRAAKLRPKKYGERLDIEQNTSVVHYIVEVPPLAKNVDEWLTPLSSGVPSLAHSPRS